MEPLELKKSIALLEEKLSSVKGKFTLNDASSMTGISINDARDALNELMNKYMCRLVVTESGDMVYDFGSSPQRRGEKTWAERWDSIKSILWKGFQIFFKAWISVMLVVYFIVFVVIMIAVVLGLSAGGSSDDDDRGSSRSSGGGMGMGGYMMTRMISEMFFSIFRWRSGGYGHNTYHARDDYGYEYKKYEQPNMGNTKKKNFIASVYDFVFGPPRVEPAPFTNEKEVAAFARQSKGIVTIPDLKALAGWNQDEAQSFMTNCVVRFNGDAEITEEGVLYGNFEDLRRSVNQDSDGVVEWFWDEYEPDYELTGNSTGRNLAVIGMNLVNLIGGGYFLINGEEPIRMYLQETVGIDFHAAMAVQIGLGFIPFLFSLIFFSIPVLRYFYISPKKKRRHTNNIRKRLIKEIYKSHGAPLTLNQLQRSVNTGKEEELSASTIKQIMDKLIIDWGGTADLSANGNMVYHFEQLQIELSEAEMLRDQLDSNVDLGEVYLDTGDM